MSDFFFDHFPKILFVIIFALIGLMIAALFAMEEQRDEFMQECTKYRKQYECVAMWRAGNSSTVVMPMPMVIR